MRQIARIHLHKIIELLSGLLILDEAKAADEVGLRSALDACRQRHDVWAEEQELEGLYWHRSRY